jgi:hypothetical protein
MFIEKATTQDFFSLQRGETEVGLTHYSRRNIALRWSATIEFIALSINSSLRWSEMNGTVALLS